MRERTVSSTPSLLTPVAGATEAGAPTVEAVRIAADASPLTLGAAPNTLEALDKYDISLIACTD